MDRGEKKSSITTVFYCRTDCHVGSGHCAEQEVVLIPKAGDNKNKYGVFVQGSEFEDEPCLASTTV